MNSQVQQAVNKITPLRLGVAAAAILFLFLTSGILLAAAKAGASLIFLAIIGLTLFALYQSIPLLAQKWENKLLSLRKAEARQNPIEQLQNFFKQKKLRVQQFKQAVTAIGAQIRSLGDMLAERKRAKPGYDASKQEQSLAAMRAAHTALINKYQNAERALSDLESAIEDKKFEWNFAQAGQTAIASLNATSGEELVDQILADEAFSSVRDNFHSVFAELEMEAGKLDSAKQLSFGNGMVLDMSEINLMEKV